MIKKNIPLLPLRDIVVFPGMVAPLFVGRKLSVNALNHAMSDDKKINEDDLKVLHLVHNNPEISQRGIAEQMGFSLGKVNYCIKALTEIGFIKLQNFSRSDKKLGYLYVLTPEGIKEKTILTKQFLQIKQLEYEKLYNYFNGK